MIISEFSNITGLTAHTLRYYEKINLIYCDRDSSGHRNYKDTDIAWIEFIQRLKDTKMPLVDIIRYAELRNQGEETMQERLELLIKHETEIVKDILKLNENLGKLQSKIDYYRSNI